MEHWSLSVRKESWRQLITNEMSRHGEVWENVRYSTLSIEQLDVPFPTGVGLACGRPFTLWTDRRVYFPAVYDGMEWCASVSRIIDGLPTEHIGKQ